MTDFAVDGLEASTIEDPNHVEITWDDFAGDGAIVVDHPYDIVAS